MNPILTLHAAVAGSCPLLLLCASLRAQTYPAKPVRVVVPFPGWWYRRHSDTGRDRRRLRRIGVHRSSWKPSRALAHALGTDTVANAAPDGYTLLVATITGSVGPLINPNFKYDLRKDFVAVGMFATAPNIAVVPADLPVASIAELVELARKSPGKLNYAHAGVGSTNHLPVEFLKTSRNLNIVPVPYKGQPPAITDVISGQIQLFFGAPALLVPHVKTGKLKAIAVTSGKRLDDLPSVPTLAEGNFGDVLGGSGWFGIVAPQGTASGVINRLNQEINAALKSPEVIERLRIAYAFPAGGSSDEFSRFLTDEGARWTKLVKDANIKPE